MDGVIRFFQEGGLFMYPIGLVAAVGLAITLERMYVLSSALHSNRRDFERLLAALRAGRMQEVRDVTAAPRSGVGHMLAQALARLPTARARSDLERAMDEALLEVLPVVERRTGYLAALANVATLLGLLGTIIGLIAAFTAVANVDPAQKAALLSKSISIGMNTTAFGLMVAIPLVLLHTFLEGRTTAITESLEIAQLKLLNQLEERQGTDNFPEARAPAGGAGSGRATVQPRDEYRPAGEVIEGSAARGANSAAA